MIDYDHLVNWTIADVYQDYDEKDCMLYALGLGLGSDPVSPTHLRYVYEKSLVAFPAIALVLASSGLWVKDPSTGIDFSKLLHAEEQIEFYRPMPVRGTVRSKTRVAEVIDKGEGRGAIVISERVLYVDDDEAPFAKIRSSAFCRADGGFGGPQSVSPPPHTMPEREPDHRVNIRTLPQAALIYRLSGDDNPLHADPALASDAGFERPILHGLCAFGIALCAIAEGLTVDPVTFAVAGVRFTAPIYPGETMETAMWREDDTISFRARSVERDKLVLNNGWIRIKAQERGYRLDTPAGEAAR